MNNQRASGLLCAVQSCNASKRTHPTRTFFSFPSDEKQRDVWLEKCGLKTTNNLRRLKVCEKHFNPHHIGKRKLFGNSIPEFYLTDSVVSYTTNDNITISEELEINNSSEYIIMNVNDIVEDSIPANKSLLSLKPELLKKKYIASFSTMRILINKIKYYVKMIKYYKGKMYFFKNKIKNYQMKNTPDDHIDSLPDLSSKKKEIIKMVMNDSLNEWPCTKCKENKKLKNDIINSVAPINFEPSNPVEDPIDNTESVNNENSSSNIMSGTKDLVSVNYGNDENQKSVEQSSCPKEIQYECEKCGFKEDTYKDLVYHMRVHPGLMLYECERCGKEFHHCSRYLTHSYNHKEDTPFQCNICKKGFKGLRYLKQHELIHKTEKIHPCPHCDKWFCHMKGLNQHLLCHKAKFISCTKCNKKFQFNSQLKTHMEYVHLIGIKKIAGKIEHFELQKQFTCEVCGKLFNRARSLSLHINNMHNKRKDDTLLYSKRHYHRDPNKSSMDPKTMESNKKYTCDDCGKPFKTILTLKRHKIIHMGVKNFVCAHCNKAFTFKMYLERHIRLIHDTTNPRNSVCDICGKVSADQANFRLHRLAHTGEMPFQCKFCDIKFRYAKSLRMHVTKKHENETKMDKNVEQNS